MVSNNRQENIMKSNSQKPNGSHTAKSLDNQTIKPGSSQTPVQDQLPIQSHAYKRHGNGGGVGAAQSSGKGIKVNPKYAGTTDVRFLKVALQFSYMFSATTQDMRIDHHWAVAFTLTCVEIDAFLGRNKCGFCWTLLTIDEGNPYWYWSLGRGYDQHVLVEDLYSSPRVSIQNSVADPYNEIRSAIDAIVKTGMRRARFFSASAANEGEVQ
jgi:hypothetical protein